MLPDLARKREAKLLERVQEQKKEAQTIQAQLMTAQAESKKLSTKQTFLPPLSIFFAPFHVDRYS